MDINELVLESQVVLLTGGRDRTGVQLITFPTDSADVVELYGTGSILSILRLYTDIAGGQVIVLYDLQHNWSGETVIKLTDILNQLQASRKNCIQKAYLVRTSAELKTRTLNRSLSRLEASDRRMPCFPVQVLQNHDQLYSFIDKTQLTSDYGGTLMYSHSDWMAFFRTYVLVSEKAKIVLGKIRDHKTNLQRGNDSHWYDEASVQHITETYTRFLLTNDVDLVIESLRGNLKRLKYPDDDVILSHINPETVRHITTRTHNVLDNIQAEVSDIEAVVDRAGTEAVVYARLTDCQHNATEVVETIELMKQEISRLPSVAQNETEAVTNRNRFISSALEPSKAIVSCASNILQDLDPSKHSTHKSYQMALHVARHITEALRPFTDHMNTLNETYTRMHLFYVILTKIKRWKAKATQFILKHLDRAHGRNKSIEELNRASDVSTMPSGLSSTDRDMDTKIVHKTWYPNNAIRSVVVDKSQSCDVPKVKSPTNWDAVLQGFLLKHPAPNYKHLRLVTKHVPSEITQTLKDEAEILEERTLFILAFLSRDQFKLEDISLIQDWEVKKIYTDYDDVSLNVSTV